MTSQPDSKRDFLRHTLATLAYRAGKVLRSAPSGFAEMNPCEGSRSASEIVAHMGDLLEWAQSMARGEERWAVAQPLPWDAEVERFFTLLKGFDAWLAGPDELHAPPERLFQGPIADALTHVGQLAIIRRVAEAPVRAENYFVADIEAGR